MDYKLSTMSVGFALKELDDIPDDWVGSELKRLLRWQHSKGQTKHFSFGWHLRHIVRSWQIERNKRLLSPPKHQKRSDGDAERFNDLLRQAMNEVQG